MRPSTCASTLTTTAKRPRKGANVIVQSGMPMQEVQMLQKNRLGFLTGYLKMHHHITATLRAAVVHIIARQTLI
ncbi:hypothetical protein ABIB40_002645 [Pedobacter sp. UYP30]